MQASTRTPGQLYALVIGAVYLLVGVVGLLVAILGFTGIDLMHTLLNITESTDPDNFLHLVTGGIALFFGTVGAAGPHDVAA